MQKQTLPLVACCTQLHRVSGTLCLIKKGTNTDFLHTRILKMIEAVQIQELNLFVLVNHFFVFCFFFCSRNLSMAALYYIWSEKSQLYGLKNHNILVSIYISFQGSKWSLTIYTKF